MVKEKKEYILSKQLLRAGTSIGANVEEALAASSLRDFSNRMSIASREARESAYWIRLLKDSEYIDKQRAEKILNEANELIRLLTAIVKTSSQKWNNE